MKKKTPLKGVGLAADLISFVNDISNFSGCVNALLRKLMHDKALQDELTKTHGIVFVTNSVISTVKPKDAVIPVQNGWEVEV